MLFAHHRVKGNEPVYQLCKETLEVIQSSLDSAYVISIRRQQAQVVVFLTGTIAKGDTQVGFLFFFVAFCSKLASSSLTFFWFNLQIFQGNNVFHIIQFVRSLTYPHTNGLGFLYAPQKLETRSNIFWNDFTYGPCKCYVDNHQHEVGKLYYK